MSENNYGIWIGKDSTVAMTEDLTIAFLRLKEDLIASILRCNKTGVIGVAYGHGNTTIGKEHTYTAAAICDGEEKIIKNNDEANDFIKLHSSDKISYDEQNKKLIYTTYDNKIFENIFAEKIEMSDFVKKNLVDNSLPLPEKMARWNIGKSFEKKQKEVDISFSTHKYSVCFSINLHEDGFIYCRVGQNGYCEKGWAMFPTICIRGHQTYMLENNLSAINEYKPNEDWFVVDGCSFPEDGAWYWAVKEITDDIIYLQGCVGAIYEIHRK